MGFRMRNELLATCYEATVRSTGIVDAAALQAALEGPWKLEYVVGRLAGTIGHDAIDVLGTLSIGIPNEAHMLCAALLAQGGLHVTLNFDQGIERAYRLLSGNVELPEDSPVVYRTALSEWRSAFPGAAPRLTVAGTSAEMAAWAQRRTLPALVKLHGTLESDQFGRLVPREASVVDEIQLSFLSVHQLAALDELAQHDRVLVTGYSGNDIDCYEPLLDRLQSSHFAWVAPDNAGVADRVREIDPHQPTAGTAVSWLRTHVAWNPPTWPQVDPGTTDWIGRYRAWESNVLRLHGDHAFAEAFAWMLHDAREHDRSITIFCALEQGTRTPGLQIRFANALYDRNCGGDRRAASNRYWNAARGTGRAGGQRTYALIRYGESYRAAAANGDLRALVRAVGGPLVGLAIARFDGATPAQRALGRGALAHFGLRTVEQLAPSALEVKWLRRILGFFAVATTHLLRRTMRTLAQDRAPVGNRAVFLEQQTAEADALAAVLKGSRPASTEWSLSKLRRAYERMPDGRGVANIDGALALAAMARGDLDQARALLVRAEHGYTRPDGSLDPSGEALVCRRTRLLEALRSQRSLA